MRESRYRLQLPSIYHISIVDLADSNLFHRSYCAFLFPACACFQPNASKSAASDQPLLLPTLLSPDGSLARRMVGLEIDMDSVSVAEFDIEFRVSNKVRDSSHGRLWARGLSKPAFCVRACKAERDRVGVYQDRPWTNCVGSNVQNLRFECPKMLA